MDYINVYREYHERSCIREVTKRGVCVGGGVETVCKALLSILSVFPKEF